MYPLVLDDGKRNLSCRPFAKNDCTVRALAIATKVPYDIAYQTLKDEGRKCNDGFDLGKYFKRLSKGQTFYGWTVRRVQSPRTLNIGSFAARFPKGRFVVELASHVVAMVDGKAHDLIRVDDDCTIYVVWEFRRLD